MNFEFVHKNKKAVLFFIGALFGVGILALPFVTFAAPAFDFGLSDLSRLGLGNADIRVIIIRLIQVALGFLGIVAVSIVLYGGYLWMTSAGNAQRVEQAKQVLKNGLIGLVIILSAYTIVAFVIGTFISRILNEAGGGPGQGPCTNCSALGGGIIEDHYPDRNATGIPRTAHVIITFKEPILVVDKDDLAQSALQPKSFINPADQDSITNNWTGKVNSNIFKLQPVNSDGSLGGEVDLAAFTSVQKKTFSLFPVGLLGSPDSDIKYRATVKGGANGLTKEINLVPAMGGDYTWDFTVSTKMDTTPPKVIDVKPADGNTTARNAAVLIMFNEPIDPVSLQVNSASSVGITVPFKQSPPPPPADVPGVYEITNGYQTITFHTNDKCGVNSCGQDIFCFNASSQVDGLVKAATLLRPSPPCDKNNPVNVALLAQGNESLACTDVPGTGLLYDGIVDMSGNSLDGNGNNKAEGPAVDDYSWTFNTDNKIVNRGPKIAEVRPALEDSGVSMTDPATATFNRRLLKFTSDDFRFYEQAPSVCLGGLNDGKACNSAAECPDKGLNKGYCGRFSPTWARQSIDYRCGVTGEVCAPPSAPKVCSGGAKNGQVCRKDLDCGINVPCQFVLKCQGGGNDGNACSSNSDCPGGSCPKAACPAPPSGEERNDCGRTIAELNHGTFNPDKSYEPRVGSTIIDEFQNCYSPAYGPKICQGGQKDGFFCSSDSDCPGGACAASTTTGDFGETSLDLDNPANAAP